MAAFSSTIDNNGVPEAVGRLKMTSGTYTPSGGATGGDIDTGLKYVKRMFLQSTGTAVSASEPVINETLPVAGSAVTIVTVADTPGIWMAFGD